MTEPLIDPDALKRYSFNVWTYKQGEMVSLLIHLGDRLGLYRAMRGAGPLSSQRTRRPHRAARALGARMAAGTGRRAACSTGTTTTASS